MALDRYADWRATNPRDERAAGATLLVAKGVGDDDVYIVEIDPATGFFPVAPTAGSFGWGDPATGTRAASMIATYQTLPAPGTGANGVTGTMLEKSVANDGQALDTTLWGYDEVTAKQVRVNASEYGNIRVAGLVTEDWRGMTALYPSATQETFEYFRDAAKTQSICVVTVDYTDSTKERISSVVRS